MEAIRPFLHDDGLHDMPGWNFVDWGYRAGEDVPVKVVGACQALLVPDGMDPL